MERRRPRAGTELRWLCVGMLAILGLGLWTATAGAQVYPATETVQLVVRGIRPVTGCSTWGRGPLDGPLYRALLRFEVPAIDPGRLLGATLVLAGSDCYLGEAPA